MKNEEHDDLWELLGQAKTPAVSPFFSRNVLRALREEKQETLGFFFWLRRHWQLTAISACALVAAAGFALQQETQPAADPVILLAHQVSASPDYQVINNLDELLDSEHNSVWLEASIN